MFIFSPTLPFLLFSIQQRETWNSMLTYGNKAFLVETTRRLQCFPPNTALQVISTYLAFSYRDLALKLAIPTPYVVASDQGNA